ncbi:MAG: VacJ family lipoprotein [Pseudomonadota bacterium]
MRQRIGGFVLAFALVGCVSMEQSGANQQVYDPLEGWNRGMFAFNESVDKAVLGPAADGYRYVTTPTIRSGVNNFLSNLGQPVVFANTVLQGKPGAAFDTLNRFALNTTVGIAGVFDPASAVGIPRHREDFGQTLGTWGVPGGAFLVLPFGGGSNVRDVVGIGVDNVMNPLNYAEFENDDETRIGLAVIGALSARERLEPTIQILRDQPEPYTALRRNYDQSRRAAIRDGQEEQDPYANLPEFDDYLFDEEVED